MLKNEKLPSNEESAPQEEAAAEEAEVAAPEQEESSYDDGFGAFSPTKKSRTYAVMPVREAATGDAWLKHRAKTLAVAEMKLWKTRTEENSVKAPTLPPKQKDYFRAIQWWTKPGRQNLYGGLQRVAVSYLVVACHFRALGWLVFLKRNARFMPTDDKMATEYLRRY